MAIELIEVCILPKVFIVDFESKFINFRYPSLSDTNTFFLSLVIDKDFMLSFITFSKTYFTFWSYIDQSNTDPSSHPINKLFGSTSEETLVKDFSISNLVFSLCKLELIHTESILCEEISSFS